MKIYVNTLAELSCNIHKYLNNFQILTIILARYIVQCIKEGFGGYKQDSKCNNGFELFGYKVGTTY